MKEEQTRDARPAQRGSSAARQVSTKIGQVIIEFENGAQESWAPYKTTYHLFWDRGDQWIDDERLANDVYDALAEVNKRLYRERYDTAAAYEDGQPSDEACVRADGAFPV